MTVGQPGEQERELVGQLGPVVVGGRTDAHPEQRVEHVLGPRTTVAPPASSAFGPAAWGLVIWPGTAPTGLASCCANPAVTSEPDRSPASTTTVIAASAAMIRLRAGNIQRRTGVPGGSSDTDAPVATTRRCSPRRLAG